MEKVTWSHMGPRKELTVPHMLRMCVASTVKP